MGRFIRERAGDEPVPPIMCLTATAKPDVKSEIFEYFREELGVELRCSTVERSAPTWSS